MKTDYGAAVSRGWKFARSVERLFLLFIIYLASALMVLVPIIFIYRNITLGTLLTGSSILSFLGLFVAIIIVLLLLTFSSLMFIHNYANQRSLAKSAGFAKSRYFRFLAAMILASLISMVIGLPFSLLDAATRSVLASALNFIVSLLLTWVFFFVGQEIAVGGSRAVKSLSNSYSIFKRNWVQIAATWIITTLLAFLIIIVFAVPLLVAVVMTVLTAIGTGQVVPAILANLPLFIATCLILLVGVALAGLFTIGIATDVYMQIKRKRK